MPAKAKKRTPQREVARNVRPDLAKRLEAFRLTPSRELSYESLANLIGGISLETVRRAELGFPLSKRITSKIENFLSGMEGSNRAA